MSVTLERGVTVAEARYALPDFGAWMMSTLDQANVSLYKVSQMTGMTYSFLHRLGSSGQKGGKPQQPGQDTIAKIADAMIELGVISSRDEAFLAAGYHVQGYKTVSHFDALNIEDSDIWPDELKEAMFYSQELTPEARLKVYALWRSQALAHAEIERERKRIMAELETLRQQRDDETDRS